MNDFDTSLVSTEEGIELGRNRSSSMHNHAPTVDFRDRLAELEMENSRLHRLVAELLLKNQKLRRAD